MFNHHIVQCSGCQKFFAEECIMSQHLTQNAECKRFNNSSHSPPVNDNVYAHTAGPHAPIQENDDSLSTTGPPPMCNDDAFNHHSLDHEKVDTNGEDMLEPSLLEINSGAHIGVKIGNLCLTFFNNFK
jgi:hypothetical protein